MIQDIEDRFNTQATETVRHMSAFCVWNDRTSNDTDNVRQLTKTHTLNSELCSALAICVHPTFFDLATPLAKWKAYSQTHTNSCSRRGGTASHSPPEIWKDINQPRTVIYDVYSFAVLLWELLTEQEPFKNVKESDQIRVAVVSSQRPDLSVITGPQTLVKLDID